MLYEKDEIMINGKTLNDKQKVVLIEAINGHMEFGVQCRNFLADECEIDFEEQKEIVSEIDDLFIK